MTTLDVLKALLSFIWLFIVNIFFVLTGLVMVAQEKSWAALSP